MKVGRKAPSVAAREDADKGLVKDKAAGARRRTSDSPSRPRRNADAQQRGGRTRGTASARRPRESRGLRQGPQTAPTPRPAERQARPKTAVQAKARSKARKAKAPKVVRPPLRERLIARLATVDLRPQTLAAKVPFVVLIIGALGIGLATTLWLSTDAAQRSYQLSSARSTNEALSQQKEALERDVLEAQSAPALAGAARNLGMIPSKDTAHLVQDPTGNWIVVGKPKPAEGVPPPPLNAKLPDDNPPPAPTPAPVKPKPGSSVEVPVRITPLNTLPLPGAAPLAGVPPAAGPEVPVRAPSATDLGTVHAPTGATLPGPADVPPPAAVDVPPAAVPPALPDTAPPALAPAPVPPVVPVAPLAGPTQ